MTTTMSKARAIEQLQRMGVTYIGPAEWQKISNAAQTPSRRRRRRRFSLTEVGHHGIWELVDHGAPVRCLFGGIPRKEAEFPLLL
jgi:hypothetical protein